MIKPKKLFKAAIISIVISLSFICLSTIFIHSDRNISYSDEVNVAIPSTVVSRGWPVVTYENYSYSKSNWFDLPDEPVTEQIFWRGIILDFTIAFLVSFALSIFILNKKNNK